MPPPSPRVVDAAKSRLSGLMLNKKVRGLRRGDYIRAKSGLMNTRDDLTVPRFGTDARNCDNKPSCHDQWGLEEESRK